MSNIPTMNLFGVGITGPGVCILRPVSSILTPDEALNLAAWLVAMAEHQATHSFDEVLKAVQES